MAYFGEWSQQKIKKREKHNNQKSISKLGLDDLDSWKSITFFTLGSSLMYTSFNDKNNIQQLIMMYMVYFFS